LKKHISKEHPTENSDVADDIKAQFIVPKPPCRQKKSKQRKNDASRQAVTCEVCKKTIQRQSLVTHMMIHTGEKPFKCHACDKAYRDNSALRKHRLIHLTPTPYKCTFCDMAFHSQGVARKHTKFECPNNPDREQNLIQSIREQQKNVCPHCEKVSSSKRNLKRHIDEVHLKINSFPCEVCGHVFTRKPDLTIHMSVHTSNNRPHACEVCGKCFRLRTNMLQHQRGHQPFDLPWKCNICQGGFPSRDKLKKHQPVHALDTQVKLEPKPKKGSKTTNFVAYTDAALGDLAAGSSKLVIEDSSATASSTLASAIHNLF
jgi:KRAB domain-containing zinc finger protein